MTSETPDLITSLRDPDAYSHETEDIRLLQTHISWVLLTGPYAYKIKKPVDLGFVDYTTLDRREHYCREEMRLNRRLAPDLYRAVVPVTGSESSLRMDGSGDPLEYAVKMVQFDQDNLLSRMLERGELRPDHMDEMARIAADFHAEVPRAEPGDGFATPEAIRGDTLDNFDPPLQQAEDDEIRRRLETLRTWSIDLHERLESIFERRLREGYVREGHGDMHLENMLEHEGELRIFDCIEFNDDFRWIDVINEVAFAVMDLESRERPDFAARFLNRYLEETGDYEGVSVLRYYKAYRSMVRLKVNFLTLKTADLDPDEAESTRREFNRYLRLTESYRQSPSPHLIITQGLSGSGKTTVAQDLLETLGAVRVRSDVERKRLAGLSPRTPSESGVGEDLYAPEMTDRTYDRLAELAETILEAGFTAIVDATFLDRERRGRFRELAERLEVPFHILACRTPKDVLKERVSRRATESSASDAGPEVLKHQRKNHDPLTDRERSWTVTVDTTENVDPDHVVQSFDPEPA